MEEQEREIYQEYKKEQEQEYNDAINDAEYLEWKSYNLDDLRVDFANEMIVDFEDYCLEAFKEEN